MKYDVLIKGGRVIDGTGGDAFVADIGIKDGRIAEIGKLTGAADEVVDASGAIVTPGFTDLHTHYDGQISWDSDLAPSSYHGVTTCVMGNCGVGFAPVRASDRDRIIRLFEGVEDIPGTALAEGMPWNWESFPEYLDAIDSLPHAIDFATQVTHDALRIFVMGERGFNAEVATDDDISKMHDLAREALVAGAAGFSTGRSDNHKSADGQDTPAFEADVRELTGIAKALVGLDHGVLQAVSDFDLMDSPEKFDGEFDLIEKMAEAAPGHHMSISLMQRDQQANQWELIIKRAEQAAANGHPIHFQVGARGIGVILGYEATFQPFMGFPTYKKLADLPLAEKVAALRTPEIKAKILSEKSEKMAGDGSAVPPLADVLLAQIEQLSARMFRLAEEPDYEPTLADSLYAEAKGKGMKPLEVIYDALLEDDGHQLLYFPIYNYTEFSLDNVLTMLKHPLALPGLSDGGAHVGTICDASFPSFMLSHWTRDRKGEQLPLERVVQMMTSDTSSFIGLSDRGVLKPGLRADINVIDMKRLRLKRPRLVKDLPAGGQRLLQDAEGYVATYVAGTKILENGVLTGKHPGRLVRVGQTAS